MNLSLIKILLAVLFAMNSLIWSRFFSWGFLSSWWKSEISVPVAPLLTAFTLFIWLIFDESVFLDKTRQKFDGFLKRHSSISFVLIAILTVFSLTLTNSITPPKWTDLINKDLLMGYEDEFTRAQYSKNELSNKNSEFSILLETTIDLQNIKKEQSNWTDAENFRRLNQLQKKLESIQPSSGYAKNLKNYCKALLYYTFLRLEHFKNDKKLLAKKIERSIQDILKSKKKYQTDKLNNICKRMLANTYYEMGNVKAAIKYWEKLEKNPNVCANLHVGYRDLGDFDSAMRVSSEGFRLIDKGLKEDSQSQEALVANTMTTLMHLQKLDEAISLYKQRYISKGRTSDSGLLQLYAFLLVLTNDIDSAEKLIMDGSFSNDEDGYIHLLISLQKKKRIIEYCSEDFRCSRI